MTSYCIRCSFVSSSYCVSLRLSLLNVSWYKSRWKILLKWFKSAWICHIKPELICILWAECKQRAGFSFRKKGFQCHEDYFWMGNCSDLLKFFLHLTACQNFFGKSTDSNRSFVQLRLLFTLYMTVFRLLANANVSNGFSQIWSLILKLFHDMVLNWIYDQFVAMQNW